MELSEKKDLEQQIIDLKKKLKDSNSEPGVEIESLKEIFTKL